MKSLKNIILILLCAFTSYLFAANDDVVDTIKISEINVIPRIDFYTNSFNYIRIDSQKINNNKNCNLSELLSLLTPLQIQSNGSMGAAASAFIRGCNSYHTSVNWNGFPIGSITLGTTDLSLINTGLIDEIIIVKSSQATVFGNNSFGGAINLKNTPNWDKNFNISYTSLYGSFNEIYNSLNFKSGNKKIFFNTNINQYYTSGRFPYHDIIKPNSPIVFSDNNKCRMYSGITNFHMKLPNKFNFEAGLWAYTKNKQLPAIMGSNKKSLALQEDKSIKSYIKLSKAFEHSILFYNTALIYDFQKYTDKDYPEADAYTIYSYFHTLQNFNNINFRYYHNNILTADLGIDFSFLNAETNNYSKKVYENKAALVSGLKVDYKNFKSIILFRQEINSYYKIKPIYSISINYKLNSLLSTINIGRNFRTPTFNDRYWNPGGNLNLVPEFGWNIDGGFEINKSINANNDFVYNINGYYKNINNIIQWLPDKNNQLIWTPRNEKKAWIKGLETTLKYIYKNQSFSITTNLFYNLNISEIAYNDENRINKRKLMEFVPINTVNSSIELHYKKYFTNYIFKYTGKRYTDEGNIELNALPAYSLSHIYIGRNFGFKNTDFTVVFKIINVFNKEYQIVTAYPMPGRIFQFSLKIDYNKLTNN